jgi:signal transduction histidine kinase
MDSRLVRLEGRLVGSSTQYGDLILTLQSGKTAFTAVLEQPQPVAGTDSLRPDSMVRLTGVCEVTWDALRVPPSPVAFRLLLRTPEDITVSQLASWWTVRNTLGVLASMSALMAMVLGWVFMLQRRVNHQTAQIAARLESEKLLQTQLAQSQKLESVGRLAGGVAHDFNNLLTVINGYSELALSRLAEADPLRAPLDQIRRAGERAASLTQQLLGFSRKQIIQPKPVDLNAVVTDARGMLRPLLGELIAVRTLLEPKLGSVVADPGQIEQILVNLAVNAHDAMPRGGILTIETRNLTIDKHARDKRSLAPGQYVMLRIADTGEGMSEDVRQHIFEPFFTTKERGKGTGLGLATVYGIVKQNGGSIEVESAVGAGTSFEICWPRVDAPANRTEPAPDRRGATAGVGCVLVVEDEEDVRKYAVEVLESHGYTVLPAADGETALQLAAGYAETIDLLITDVVLPGINGREVAEQLRTQRPGIRVLYKSGYARDVIARHGVLAPEVEYLAKPYSPADLLSRVQQILSPQ